MSIAPCRVATSSSLPVLKTNVSCLSPSKGQQQGMTPREGVQVHSYHKLFWRLNCTLEFNIFHHDDRNIYEVAAYNSEKDYEYEPIFLHAAEVMKLCAPSDALESEVEKVRVELSKDRLKKTPPLDEIVGLAKKALFKKGIEARLTPKADGTISFTGLPGEELALDSIMYVAGNEEENNDFSGPATDSSDSSDVPEKPANKQLDRTASRRRTIITRARSSLEDYNKTLSLLHQHSLDLKQANMMAENMLNLTRDNANTSFNDAFLQACALFQKKSRYSDKSHPLGKFRWAGHRVVLQLFVAAVKTRMDVLGVDKPQASPREMVTSNVQVRRMSRLSSQGVTPSTSRRASVIGPSALPFL